MPCPLGVERGLVTGNGTIAVVALSSLWLQQRAQMRARRCRIQRRVQAF